MKKINILFLIISFIILVIACSALSMSAVASNYRYTWIAMNPWNGVEGIAFTIPERMEQRLTLEPRSIEAYNEALWELERRRKG